MRESRSPEKKFIRVFTVDCCLEERRSTVPSSSPEVAPS